MKTHIDRYLRKEDWRVKENSNMGYSLQGLNVYITEKCIADYWLNEVYPADISRAHRDGDIYIHDTAGLSGYCTGWDLTDLLMKGFRGVRGKIEANPARHFRVALLQIVNFMFTVAGEVSGAIAFSNVDTLLAPFIREDGLTYDELKQNLQEFLFNLNVPTRVGFQQPFTGITLDLTVPDHLKNTPAIVGGKILDYTYGDLQDELDLFNMAFAEVLLEGDGGGRPFPFPLPTYSLTEDFDWDNPVYDKIWEVASKFGTPTFTNFINSNIKPEDVRAMCCNLKLDMNELKNRGGGLFSANPKTGSIGVVSINLPRIGYESESPEEFFDTLAFLMWKAKESLEIKRKFIEDQTGMGLYPYSRFYLQDVKDATGGYWNNHFSTIAVLGMNDMIFNMFGESIMTDFGKDFAIDVLEYMRDVLLDLQKETGNLYNLEAAPAESASYKLALKDAKKHPEMRFYNIEVDGGTVPFYCNSTHLPVANGLNLFEALAHQEPLQVLYSGGTSFHCFLGEKAPDIGSLKSLVKKIATSFRIPYFTITPTFSICLEHGYIVGEQPLCPDCGAETEIYSRVVGYLSPLERWNDGKTEEFAQRTNYKVDGETT